MSLSVHVWPQSGLVSRFSTSCLILSWPKALVCSSGSPGMAHGSFHFYALGTTCFWLAAIVRARNFHLLLYCLWLCFVPLCKLSIDFSLDTKRLVQAFTNSEINLGPPITTLCSWASGLVSLRHSFLNHKIETTVPKP